MENILYLDDYINFYIKKRNNIVSIKPYKNTLNKGKIIDRKKFINVFKKIKETNKLNNFIVNENVIIIINSNYNKEDKIMLQEVLEELEYKNIKFINELKLIKIDKNSIFVNYNESYFYLYYLNKLGNVEMDVYQNNIINKNLIINIFKLIDKRNILVAGKNYKELINILKTTNYNYFYYEDNKNLFLTLLLKNKSV